MTKEDWDQAWLNYYNAAYKQQANHQRAYDKAHKVMLLYHGVRPSDPPNPLPKPSVVGVVKLGLTVKKGLSMPFKLNVQTVAAAIVAAASAFAAAHGIAIADGVVTSAEWFNLAWGTVTAIVAALFVSNKPKA